MDGYCSDVLSLQRQYAYAEVTQSAGVNSPHYRLVFIYITNLKWCCLLLLNLYCWESVCVCVCVCVYECVCVCVCV
jgi:hypothetical protein